jgi:hypothetical protein
MSDLKKRVIRYFKGAGAGSMLISIIVHSLVIGGATVYVIQTVKPPPKANFAGGGGNNAPAVQHPVKMSNTQPKLESLTKRLSVDTPSAGVSLPDLPTGSTGIGGPSLSGSLGGGPAGPGVGAGPSLRGPIMPAFGFREAQPNGTLVGNFYDFKQLRGEKPKPNPDYKGDANARLDAAAANLFWGEAVKFIDKNWSRTGLYKYFTSPNPLFATQLYIPTMSAEEAPKAYGVEKLAKGKAWIALYRGRVSPPETGTYRFIGGADDLLIVRFDGRIVLDGGLRNITKLKSDKPGYKYGFKGDLFREGFPVSAPLQLRKDQFYDIQIMVGEAPGGEFNAFLLFEQEGVTYKQTAKGTPILPLFRVANSKTETSNAGPPFMEDGPIWRASPPPN